MELLAQFQGDEIDIIKDEIMNASESKDKFTKKFALFFCNSEYEKLRQIKGCGGIQNLPGVKNDLQNIREIAEMMNIPKAHIHEFVDSNYDLINIFVIKFGLLIKAYMFPLEDKICIGGKLLGFTGHGIPWSDLKKLAMRPGYDVDKLNVSVLG